MNFFKWLSIRTQLFVLAIATGVAVSVLLIIYGQVKEDITKNDDVYTSC